MTDSTEAIAVWIIDNNCTCWSAQWPEKDEHWDLPIIQKAKNEDGVEVSLANSSVSHPFLVQFVIVLFHLPFLMHRLALFMSVWTNLDDTEENIVLHGPLCSGRWNLPQDGQAEIWGIVQPGIDCFHQLGLEAKAGHTAQGLVVEKPFLEKHQADKGIQDPTLDEERARRCRRGGGGRAVAVAPVMDATAVQGHFDD